MRVPQRIGAQSTVAGAGVGVLPVLLVVVPVEDETFEVESDMLDLMSNRRAVAQDSETGPLERHTLRRVSFFVFRTVSRCARVFNSRDRAG